MQIKVSRSFSLCRFTAIIWQVAE